MLKRAVVVVLAVALVAGLALAEKTTDEIKKQADAIAAQFKIGNRPAVLTAADIENFLAALPSFGDKTIEALKKSAPYDSLSKLEALGKKTKNGEQDLLTDKQLLLIAVFFNLKP